MSYGLMVSVGLLLAFLIGKMVFNVVLKVQVSPTINVGMATEVTQRKIQLKIDD